MAKNRTRQSPARSRHSGGSTPWRCRVPQDVGLLSHQLPNELGPAVHNTDSPTRSPLTAAHCTSRRQPCSVATDLPATASNLVRYTVDNIARDGGGMSRVVSLRLKDEQVERLQRAARQLGRSPSEAAALLLEESLREREYPSIEFRDSTAGRQAYLVGTRIAAWHVALLAQGYEGDASKTAAYLEVPEVDVRAVLAYASAYANEIEAAIADDDWVAEHLLPLIPGFEVITVDTAAP